MPSVAGAGVGLQKQENSNVGPWQVSLYQSIALKSRISREFIHSPDRPRRCSSHPRFRLCLSPGLWQSKQAQSNHTQFL